MNANTNSLYNMLEFEGSILEIDTPEKMFTNPANGRARQFLRSVL